MKGWLPFEAIAALRFLGEGRMQTGFILGGIAIGVAVIVFMSALLTGLQANFIKRVLTSQPHIQLLPPDEIARPLRGGENEVEAATVQRPTQRVLSIDQWQSIRAEVAGRPGVAVVAPTATGSALAVRGGASHSVSITGMDPELWFSIVRVPDYLVDGQAKLDSDDILVGTELAKDLGASTGDKLNLTTASGRGRVMTIAGIFDMGNKGANERNTYVALRTAQSLLDLIGGVTSLDVTVNDIYAAEDIAQEIGQTHPVEADSWIRTNAQFFTAVRAQSTSNTLIRLFVGLSVAFGIAAVLIVSVIQRSREIGILRAMGTRRGQVLRIFLIQGGVLGFLGSLVGSAMGAAALLAWHATARQADGGELFPLVLDPSLFVVAALLATLTGVAAGMAPALRAARLDPVEAIRA
ncbi:MAG: ABC transporter permease [Alsobacter sp.]